MATSYASSNFQRESSDYGEFTPTRYCTCGNQLKVLTSWTNENPGRRFWLYPDNE
nr:zinc finger, GRF-type [Ipomoea batatas]